jgi:large subunit ribosomal protein L31
MKTGIHPTYYPNATITCNCGNTFQAGSTLESITTEICSNCHPFYTGKQKLMDTAGNLEKFKKRTEAAAQAKATAKPKKERKARGATK